MQLEDIRAQFKPIFDVEDHQRDRSDRDDWRARCASTRKLVMKYRKRDGSRVWAAWNQAGMEVCLGWFRAVLNLDDNGVLAGNSPRSGGRLLLTVRGAAAHTRHKYSAIRDGELPRYFLIVTGEVSALLCVTSGSYLYVQYKAARKKLLREAFLMKGVRGLPNSVFFGHEYIPHADS